MEKIVLIGGPCSGKTTTVNELEKQGFKVIHEMARKLINEQKKLKTEILPNKNRCAFQLKLLKRCIQNEEQVETKEGIVFIDVGIPDGIAYFQADNMEVPQEMWDAAKKTNYSKVILLEQNPVYIDDGLRIETAEKSKKIGKLLKKLYSQLGYIIHVVPFMPVEKRVELIKQIINT